jgi:nucleoside-diphosphate-sugar epimerase
VRVSDSDLNHILQHSKSLYPHLVGKRLFITGGTGFIGKWLLESILSLNQQHDLRIKAQILSRDPSRFITEYRHLEDQDSFSYLTGNIQDFCFPDQEFDYLIHAAADASARLNEEQPLVMVDTIVEGTRRVLEFARQKRIKRVLFISSGAVYGRQPPAVSNLPEEFNGGPDLGVSNSAYGEAKRLAEILCSIYRMKYDIEVVTARCFAFVGPYLNLDIHFAIGNFIRDGLEKRPIKIKGDGSPLRSYLYAADLAVWLLTILCKGQSGTVYNVGSDRALSIADLAQTVAGCFEIPPEVIISQKQDLNAQPERYVPDISRAKAELGLSCLTNLEDSIKRTIEFYQAEYSSS